jgi:hypothetical protein
MNVATPLPAGRRELWGPSSVWVGGYLIAAAALLLLAVVGSDAVKWYALTLLAAGGVILVIRNEAEAYGMVDLSNPVVMSLLASVIFFGLFGAPNVFSSASHHPLLSPGDGPLFRALATVGLSMLCIWLGSRFAEPIFSVRPQQLSPLWARVRQQRVLVAVGVGVVARLILLVTGNLGYQGYGKGGDLTGYANWLATANDLLPFAAGLFLLDWLSTRRRASLLAMLILSLSEVGTSIVAGVKGLVLSLVVFLAVVAIRAGRRPSLRAAVTAAVVFLVVVGPAVESFRHQVQQSGAPTSVSQRITAPLSLVGGGSGGAIGAARASYHNTVYEEQGLLTDIALIQSRTPSLYRYEHGSRWWRAPLAAAIPRALWPGKPTLSNGAEIATRYGGAPAGTTGTSMPATMVGDAWIQFGWWGVIGASLILGALYRLVYTWVVRRRSAGWTVALCFVVVGSLFSGGLDLASLLTSAGREFLVLGLVAVWVLGPAVSPGAAGTAGDGAGQAAT